MVASVSNPVNWIRKKVNFEDRDANADTVKTGTAWAAADDGMRVWDRNGNGSIDSGRELFGDETILANGQKAANGFAALSELDKGSIVNGVTQGAGDGKFDAKDAQYADLRIWRDLNQDGISQAGELQTLGALGISSIGVNGTTTGPQAAQVIADNRVDLREICITLAELWRADRDRLQGDFLQPIAPLWARKATKQTARGRAITNRKGLCRPSVRTTFTQNGAARTVGAIDF